MPDAQDIIEVIKRNEKPLFGSGTRSKRHEINSAVTRFLCYFGKNYISYNNNSIALGNIVSICGAHKTKKALKSAFLSETCYQRDT